MCMAAVWTRMLPRAHMRSTWREPRRSHTRCVRAYVRVCVGLRMRMGVGVGVGMYVGAGAGAGVGVGVGVGV